MTSIESPDHYDLISLGSGEAGKYIAWTISAAQGRKCAVIEREWLGGSCPNVACLPSKNVIHSAKVNKLASKGKQFGLQQNVASGSTADMLAVKRRKEEMVDGLIDMHRAVFKKMGAELIWGSGKFVGPKTIELTSNDGNKRYLKGDNIIICTGSRAVISDIPGLKDSGPLTHVDIMEIEEVPDHLIALGGGYIGLEFAQAMRGFGAAVTVVEHNRCILKKEDEDVASQLQSLLQREGVTFSTSTSISEVIGKSGEAVTLKGTKCGGPFEIKGSHILCAIGRLPNTEGIGMDIAGIDLTKAGHVVVDEWNRTSAEGVFAVGDCAGSPHFTHVAYDDFRIVRDFLIKNKTAEARRSSRQVPYTLFTDPEFAHVGLREHEAQAQGIQYRLAKLPMANFLRTRTLGETDGFAKALVSVDDDTILGFSAIGASAGELLPVIQLVMKKGLPYTDIGELVIAHPTLNEGLVYLFNAVQPKLEHR